MKNKYTPGVKNTPPPKNAAPPIFRSVSPKWKWFEIQTGISPVIFLFAVIYKDKRPYIIIETCGKNIVIGPHL
jgi:hypothetical protein